MNNERTVLAACLRSREAFDKIYDHIGDSDFTEQGKLVVNAMRDYYARDKDATRIDAELLGREISRGIANPKHRRVFEGMVSDIAALEVSPANVVHDLIAIKRETAGARLSVALATGEDINTVRKLVAEFEKWCDAESLAEQTEEIAQGLAVAELVASHFSEAGLIRLLPSGLNDRLDGGLRKGHHVVVFARPEMGKTLFVVNMMAGFLRDGHKVLYVGNEDPLPDIIMRVICRITGMTSEQVRADPDTADARAREVGYDNLVLASLAPGTPREIEGLVLDYGPDVLVVDQMRNLHVHEESRVTQLEKSATAMRNLGKRHNVLVVSVTQAGDSASGKGVLDMGDVDFSNTGIPAQADVMVGIGATQQDEAAGRRIISLPKNKRSGRHDYFPVLIDAQTSRIRSLG